MNIVLLEMKCHRCGARVEGPSEWRSGDSCSVCGQVIAWPRANDPSIAIEFELTLPFPDEELGRQIWIQLTGHNKRQDNAVDTLNRIIIKHFKTRFQDEARVPPILTQDNLRFELEWWSTEELSSLWRGHQRKVPGAIETNPSGSPSLIRLPIVVLRLHNLDCLMDGTTRINKRLADKVAEPHPVYAIEVLIQAN